jgi:hypothetical protein
MFMVFLSGNLYNFIVSKSEVDFFKTVFSLMMVALNYQLWTDGNETISAIALSLGIISGIYAEYNSQIMIAVGKLIAL